MSAADRALRHARVEASAMVVLGVVTLTVVQYLALHTRRGQAWDDRAMQSAAVPRAATVHIIQTLSQVSVGAIAVLLVALAIFAMLRRRFALAAAAAVVISGANVTTQVLKYHLLYRDDFGLGLSGRNILPSGHTTVVASLALAGLIVAPRTGRPLWAGICGFFITVVGAGVILGRWHRPSDVVTAVAVCLAWCGIALWLATAISGRTFGTQQVPWWRRVVRYGLLSLLGAAVVAIGVDRIGLYAIGSARSTALAGFGLLSCGIAAVISTTMVANWLAGYDAAREPAS